MVHKSNLTAHLQNPQSHLQKICEIFEDAIRQISSKKREASKLNVCNVL